MDELEFQRLLDLFPVVRPRDFCADRKPPEVSTSQVAQDEVKEWQNAWDEGGKRDIEIQGNKYDAFWEKVKSRVENKVGAAEAERFCQAFQRIHKKLVCEELSLDAAQGFVYSSNLQ